MVSNLESLKNDESVRLYEFMIFETQNFNLSFSKNGIALFSEFYLFVFVFFLFSFDIFSVGRAAGISDFSEV